MHKDILNEMIAQFERNIPKMNEEEKEITREIINSIEEIRDNDVIGDSVRQVRLLALVGELEMKIKAIKERNIRKWLMTVKKIHDYKGVLLFPEELFDKARIKLGMDNSDVEYAYHFVGLTISHVDANGEYLYITVPVVLFNYPQVVTEEAVEFHLDDVSKYSDIALDMATNKVLNSKVADYIISKYQQSDFNVSSFHNVHRHPYGYNEFSDGDLNLDPENPGIVYPLDTGIDIPLHSIIVTNNHGVDKPVNGLFHIFNDDPPVYEQGVHELNTLDFDFSLFDVNMDLLNPKHITLK